MHKLLSQIHNSLKDTYIIWMFIAISFSLIYIYLHFNSTDAYQVKSNEKIIYYADNITEAHNKLIDDFNDTYKGQIKVVPINLPFSQFSTNERKELLARSLRSKSEKIDVFAIDIIWGQRFAKWAENLDKEFGKDFLDKIISPTKETCFYNDSLIAIPFVADLGTLYYRDDILRTLPDYNDVIKEINNSITWDRLIKLHKRLKNKSPFYLFPAEDYEGLICSYFELVLNQNRNFFDTDSIDLTRIESRKALVQLYNMIYKYNLTPPIITGFTEFPCHDFYIKNDGVFLRSWPTFISDYEKLFKDSNSVKDYKRAPLPRFNNTETTAILGGWNLMLAKTSKNKNEAIIFMKFLLSRESQQYLFEQYGSLPVLSDVYYNDEHLPNKELLDYYLKQFKNAVNRPMLYDYTRISDIISYYIHKALKNEISIDKALQKSTEIINSKQVLFK